MRYFRKIIIALFAAALAAILCGCQDVQWDYEAEEVHCTVMRFESASVRKEPAAIGGRY